MLIGNDEFHNWDLESKPIPLNPFRQLFLVFFLLGISDYGEQCAEESFYS